MKTLIITLTICIGAFISSCTKDQSTPDSELVGKWILKDVYYSIGGPLIYTSPEEDNLRQLDFKADGTLKDSKGIYLSYTIKESSVIRLKKNSTDDEYFFFIKGDTLNLSPANPICIEGCGERYLKLK